MVTREGLDKAIDGLVSGVRSRALITLPPFLPHTQGRFDGLLNECIDLQKALLSHDGSPEMLLDVQKKVYALEMEYRRLRARLQLFPAVFLMYLGAAAAFALVRWFDIPKFVTGTLGVEAPEKLVGL